MNNFASTDKRAHLIDASVFVFRAHFAVASEFNDIKGEPVHAVYGFLNFLLTYLSTLRPNHLLVAFDGSLNTSFRNKIYPAYKANREPPDANIMRQFEYCQELTSALGLCARVDSEFEADDLIASSVQFFRQHDFRISIATADKDLAQLIVHDDDVMLDPGRKLELRKHDIKQKFGVPASAIVDYLSLAGDAVDNIPGVRGIGDKTAATLLSYFGSMDALYERLDELPFLRIRGAASLAIKLREQREQALLSRELVKLALNAPVPFELAAYQPQKPNVEALEKILNQLQFGPLTRRRIRDYVEQF